MTTSLEVTERLARLITGTSEWAVTYIGEHGRDDHGEIELSQRFSGERFSITVAKTYEPMTP